MKNRLFIFVLLIFLCFSLASAANLEVKKIDKGSVLILELENPAVYDFVIKNNGERDNFEIYSLIGVSFSPRGAFELATGETTMEVKAYLPRELRKKGSHNLEYEIKGQRTGIFKDTLPVKIVELKESMDFSIKDMKLGDKEALISIINLQNTNIENVKIKFSSTFFEAEKTFSFNPYEEIRLPIRILEDKLAKTLAGNYIATADIKVDSSEMKLERIINYLEEEKLTLDKKRTGLIIRKTDYTKKNEGNVPSRAKVEINRDILSRLFTIYSLEPLESKRKGVYVTYVWEKELQPGESFTISTTTNYTLPFILLLLVIVIAVLVKIYTMTNLVLDKRVSFVKTKGGEFALKVRLHVKARKYLENIQIIDKLPGMTQLYEKFGVRPDKIDNQSRRLTWSIPGLNAGEERIFSYIIYSKIKVVGRFELPSAMAIYEREGKTHETVSNRAFFVAETGTSEY